MKTISKIVTGIFIAILFFSCEKTIDFEGDIMNSKIVVNGFLISNTKVSASIFQSQSLLSDKDFFESLPNAKADLYVDDVFTESLKYVGKIDTFRKQLRYDVLQEIPFTSGIYTSETTVEPGKTYKLEVSCEGMDNLTCETTVPMPVEILSIDTFTETIEYEWGNEQQLTLNMRFKDPENYKNYYRVQTNTISGLAFFHYNENDQLQYSDTILIRNEYSNGFDLSDPIFKNGENEANEIVMGTPYNTYASFDDSQINGLEYKLKAHLYYNSHIPIGDLEHGNFSTQEITLYSISKDYFDYLNTANYHFWFEEDYFSEPVPVYSNVIGGLGIWSSASVSTYNLIKGNYPMPGKIYIDEYEYYDGRNGYSPYYY